MTRFGLAPTGQDLALQLGETCQQLRLGTQLLLVSVDSPFASPLPYAEGVRPRRGLKAMPANSLLLMIEDQDTPQDTPARSVPQTLVCPWYDGALVRPRWW